jgi:type IV secretory pathway TrbL component
MGLLAPTATRVDARYLANQVRHGGSLPAATQQSAGSAAACDAARRWARLMTKKLLLAVAT